MPRPPRGVVKLLSQIGFTPLAVPPLELAMAESAAAQSESMQQFPTFT